MHAPRLDPAPAPAPLLLHPATAGEPTTALQGVGEVCSPTRPGSLRVELHGHSYIAKRAASCLLEPGLGDRVWIAGEPEAGFYVLSVLERASTLPAQLRIEGDARLDCSGRLELHAHQGLSATTPATLELSGDALRVQAREGQVVFAELRAYAQRVVASLTKVTRIGQVLELLVDRVTQRSKTSFRAIEGVDQHSATKLELHASTTASIAAKHTFVNGEQLVKMDGDQIHLG